MKLKRTQNGQKAALAHNLLILIENISQIYLHLDYVFLLKSK
jgi:hypothetical protein